MKFHHFQAFEKHLNETSDDHLSHLYAIVSSSFTERDILVKVLYKRLKKKSLDLQIEKIDYSKGALSVVNASESSLFCQSKLLCIKNIEKLSDKDLNILKPVLASGDPVVFLASSSQNLKELYQKYKQDLVAIDLNLEKPWEKTERFQKWSLSYLKRFDLTMNPLDLKALVQNLTHFDEIKQELDKLITYSKGQKEIPQDAIKKLCHFSMQSALWKVSEDVVFYQDMRKVTKLFKQSLDVSDMQGLFGSIKFHLELALFLKTSCNGKLLKAYQNIHAKTLDKYKLQLKSLSAKNLENSYHSLLKYERFSRTVTTDPKTLLMCLLTNMTRKAAI